MARRLAHLWKNPFVWAFFAGIVCLTLMRPFLRFEPDPPPVLGRVPEFALVDSSGRPFTRDDLEGSVWVASFFFTRCATICPALMRSVERLQERYAEAGIEGVRLLSISVDPEHDTPERLRSYATRYHVDPDRWVLLTGEREEIRSLAQDGFKVAMGRARVRDEGIMDIAHTAKLVLVDPEGNVRGYFGADAAGRDEVFHRSRHVRDEWAATR